MNGKHVMSTIFLLLAFLFGSATVMAQITGLVVGTVKDSSGAVVPGATVTLTNKATNVTQTTTSSETGDFRFPLVPVGTYNIVAELSGFQKAELTDLVVTLGQSTRAEIVMRVAGITEAVEVSGTIATVQTESSAVQRIVEQEEVLNLPLNARNFIQLVALQPNAVPSPRTSFFRNLGGYNVVAGMPVGATAVTIDGVNIRDVNDPRINIALNPDVIEEFQEAQSNYSAAQGQAGGAQINLVTKAGTNEFHGSLFEFLRNDKMDAKNFFATTKPPFRQNQFGFSFGGPIIKNKTFIFGGYEGLRIVQKETFRYTVPTEAQRRGDFSADSPIFDPLTYNATTGKRQAFKNNVIPPDRIAPESAKALELLYPHPNLPGAVSNLVGYPPNNSTNDQFSIRIDHKIGVHDSLFARYIYYNYRRQTGIFANMPNFGDNFNTPSQNFAIAHVHTFGPNTINQFRLGYHRMTQVIEDFQIDVPINQQIGITGTSTRFLGNPTISISGLNRTAPIGNAPNNRSDNAYYIYEDFSRLLGKHALAVGFNIAFDQVNGGVNPSARGSFNFTNRYTGQIGSPATGSAVADFLLGYPSSSARGLGIGFRNFRQNRYGAYVNDDWKVANSLTLNLGLRYEYFQPGHELRNNLSSFNESTGQIIVAGQNGVPSGFREPYRKDFQPRVGFAYRILGSNKTVLRAGYGLFFMPLTMFPTPFMNLSNEPFFTQQSFFGDAVNPTLTLKNAFPTGQGIPSTALNSIQRDFRDPYMQQWNLTVERELMKNLNFEIAYLGNKGSRLRNALNINAPTAGPGVLQSKRRWPAFAGITSYMSASKSSYQSLSMKAQKRFSGGLSFVASYTWAKLLSTGGIQDPGDLGFAPVRNPYNLNAEKGRDYFDIRHRFSGSFVWALPIGKGRRVGGHWSGVLEQILGGWQTNGILMLQSGFPITPVLGFDNSNTGNFQDRPNVIGNPNNGPRTVERWFDTSVFVLPPAYSYGNAGTNIITGPPDERIDFSLFKIFKIREGTSIQFRTEFFNFTNTPAFNNPGTTFGTGAFGVITSAGEPRQIQFGLKIIF